MDSVYVRRISIARAMMKDAPILLDEATANVDPEDEKELMAQEGIYRRFITGREQAVRWKL